ncbi:prolyl oligopeptidase family serine peptidase [Haliangium sp.]|uniref:prolyl oligopeptidase family serine peptidase n=1 Tax=Haliangium sp. TaxID=2663208 RepID=UPI003D13C48B
MKRIQYLLCGLLSPMVVLTLACGGSQGQADDPGDQRGEQVEAAAPKSPLTYPEARRGDVVDDYHGVNVADPYRWLEDPDSEESRAWIEAQNRLTESYLAQLPAREAIRERLTELWNYDSYGIPEKVAGRYFFSKRSGLQNQAVLYWTESLTEEAKVLIDPNGLSDDGTVALASYEISEDGKHIAYGLQEAGSDWVEWHVREVDSGSDLEDHLRWVKFSNVTWSHSGDGFYYGRYPEPEEGERLTGVNQGQKLYFHRLGTAQSDDTLVYERPQEPKWSYSATVTEDGRYLIVSVSKGTGPQNLVFYRDLKKHPEDRANKPGVGMVALVDEFEARYSFIGNNGRVFYFTTDLNAPRGRVIAIDPRKRGRARLKEIIPESAATLRWTSMVAGQLVASYLEDARSRTRMFGLDGAAKGEVEFPGIGTAVGFFGRNDDRESFYGFTSFTTPTTIYHYDFDTGKSEVFRKPEVDFDGSRYEVKQVFYNSKDGTRVPMFITHTRGPLLDGQNPTLLYGYGGFNISLTPAFNVTRAMWLEMGGVLAIPNLRGGGEYGEEWHEAGTKLSKQNVFDDFIAAAEWLIENQYTSSSKLAIQGGSNGGLLVGATMTQRPDLIGVALPSVGVMDMLRFHKFTIGWAWVDDYGSSDDPDEFQALRAYSPYHNLEPAEYPATLITTADHDDRVVPGHSFKFTAALQASQRSDAPTLIRIETRAGHGAGKPTTMRIAEATDILTFAAANLGMRYPTTSLAAH